MYFSWNLSELMDCIIGAIIQTSNDEICLPSLPACVSFHLRVYLQFGNHNTLNSWLCAYNEGTRNSNECQRDDK